MLNWLVQMIIERIPKQQLISLQWYHRLPLTISTIDSVREGHCATWRELHTRHAHFSSVKEATSAQVTALSSIEVRSIGLGSDRWQDDSRWLGQMLSANANSIRELKVGQEHYIYLLAKGWTNPRCRYMSVDEILGRHRSETGDLLHYNLTILEMVGLKVDGLIDDFKPSRMARQQRDLLQLLVLETCPGSRALLNCLAEHITRSGDRKLTCNLKEFVFRYERPGNDLIVALERFLKAHSGLRLVSVLVDEFGLFRSGPMLANHLTTLEVLAWEVRMLPRNARNLEVSPPNAEKDIYETFRKCPNLVEISFPLDWRKHQRGSAGSLSQLSKALATSPRLRTVHIRNAPLLKGDDDDDVDAV